MKIAFFNTKKYDEKSFKKTAQRMNVEDELSFTFLEPSLNPLTAPLAADHDAVCVFVNDKVDAETIKILADRGVKMIALRCAGFNNVDLAATKEHGIQVLRVPAYSPYGVAEHAVALLLTLNRKTHRAYNRVRENNFSLDGLIGCDIHGKTVGIVGTGRIGLCFAAIMKGFGCRLLAYDVYQSDEAKSMGVEYVDIERIWHESDIISLHAPLTPQTKHIVNETALHKMKPNAILINTSRGALLDTNAVVKALKSKVIAGLGIDVYEQEEDVFFIDHSSEPLQDDTLSRLLTFPNVLVTGHQAFFTHEAIDKIAETTITNCLDVLHNRPSQNVVEPPK